MPNGSNIATMSGGATISERRLIECIVSASFWANHLNVYSAKMQTVADRYAIAASLISVITGLGAWGTIAASIKWWGQAIVGLMAFAAAIVAVIPKVRGYSDCALKAAPLSTEYGRVLGQLEDVVFEVQSAAQDAQVHAQRAVDAFQSVKEKKDALRPFPHTLESDIENNRDELIKRQEALASVPKQKPINIP